MNTPAASLTEMVDHVFYMIVGISVVMLLLITTLMIVFVIKYNRKRHPVASQIHGNIWLELTWTIIPVVIVLGMFYYGFEGFRELRNPPADSMLVKVTGRMWDWSFEYENGKQSNKLYVPVGKPVKLLLHSVDVVHSFFVPAFKIKEDVVPGRENYLWFKPQDIGPVDIFCAEYCGQRHSYMMSEVVVMEQDQFEDWYSTGGGGPTMEAATDSSRTTAGPVAATGEKADDTLVKSGRELTASKGCNACHTTDGTELIGPTFKGLYGTTQYVLADGREKTVTVDDDYIARSLHDPQAEIVKGFTTVPMTAFKDIKGKDLQAIIAYLKSLK